MSTTKWKLLIFCFLAVFTITEVCGETYYMNYKPPLVPINVDFSVGKNGIEVKSVKFGSEQLVTPIGAFKLVSKFYKSEENTSIVFKKPDAEEETIYVIPKVGAIEIIANESIAFKKDESIYKIYIVDEKNKRIVIESDKLVGEQVRIIITPDGAGANTAFDIYLTTSLQVKDKKLEFYTFGMRSDVVPIKYIKALRLNTDKPRGIETLKIVMKDGSIHNSYTLGGIAFNKYEFEEYFETHIHPYNPDVQLLHTISYIGWYWILGFVFLIALLYILHRRGIIDLS